MVQLNEVMTLNKKVELIVRHADGTELIYMESFWKGDMDKFFEYADDCFGEYDVIRRWTQEKLYNKS